MANLFIHGLWGEGPEAGANHTLTYERTLHEVRRAVRADYHPQPLLVMCYGQQNFDLITDLGLPSLLANADPIVNFSGREDRPRDCRSKGRINWGLNFWHHKLDAMQRALRHNEQVVWLDWDVHQVAPLPDDFWDVLAGGARLQAALRKYRRPQCFWRSKQDAARHYVPHGAFIYCRDREWMTAAKFAHSTYCPEAIDEVALARVIDDHLPGGWLEPGPERYLSYGFEPQCYDQRRKNALPRPRAEDVIFKNLGKY